MKRFHPSRTTSPQEGIIVPFFLTGPLSDHRIVPGKTLDRVGMHADIAPTVLDLLGL
ncbi:unnamed protein product, partial [Scytosiphon promiscuus]